MACPSILDLWAFARVPSGALLHGRSRAPSPAADESHAAESAIVGEQRGRQDAGECEGPQGVFLLDNLSWMWCLSSSVSQTYNRL